MRARVQARLFRFEIGNLGDHKSVGGGVWEARLMFAAGYRIYFGRDSDSIIVLLGGGEKSSQHEDISWAKRRWREYLEAKEHGEA